MPRIFSGPSSFGLVPPSLPGGGSVGVPGSGTRYSTGAMPGMVAAAIAAAMPKPTTYKPISTAEISAGISVGVNYTPVYATNGSMTVAAAQQLFQPANLNVAGVRSSGTVYYSPTTGYQQGFTQLRRQPLTLSQRLQGLFRAPGVWAPGIESGTQEADPSLTPVAVTPVDTGMSLGEKLAIAAVVMAAIGGGAMLLRKRKKKKGASTAEHRSA